MGRRLGEERNGSCGRDLGNSVFCVKSRGELGGRSGRMNNILRTGILGRILGNDGGIGMDKVRVKLEALDFEIQTRCLRHDFRSGE
jgi:hypothetical protein